MPEEKLNPKQSLARDTRGRGVLVAAAAGSGKTRVLTKRLMNYICDPEHPADLDRFLVITYTRAAAAELKSKIVEALGTALEADPENKLLRRQMALSRKAHIQTIHGFCSDVLREYGYIIGISPDFKIVDDERAGMMKTAALGAVIEEYYAAPDAHPGFSDLVSTLYSNRRDDDLNASILSAYEKMQSHAFPMKWAQEQLDMLKTPRTDAASTPWGREIIRNAGVIADYWRDLTKGYAERLADNEGGIDPDGLLYPCYGPYLEQLSAAFGAVSKAVGSEAEWDRLVGLARVEFPRLGSPKKGYDKDEADKIKAIIKAARDKMGELAEMFSGPSETLLGELESTAPAVQALVDLVSDFTDRFTAEKRKLGLLDYSDLEHLAVSVLMDPGGTPTAVASEYSRRFTEILVDEYQDVSEVQNDLIASVSKNGTNLFMVGDVKQSIYSFRLAKPGIFTQKCAAFTEIKTYADVSALSQDRSVTIFMNSNYRSRREVINGVNAVFECCMSPAVGDVKYAGDEELEFAAEHFTGDVPVPELIITNKKPYAGTGRHGADIEAESVAAEIRRLVDEGTDPGDIAVLMRSTKILGAAFTSALKRQGIPVSADGGSGFFESDEILALTSFLSIIDNPHKDVDIISILRYPVFGFTPDELAQLRKADRKGNLHAALNAYADVSPKARAFAELLGSLRAEASELPVSDLVWKVMNETDFIPISCAMPGGEIRRNNLLQLASMAENFDASGSEGLHKFLVWLKNRRGSKNEVSFNGPAGNGVRIMTIHKSKGLEFPVVFVVGLGKRFNAKDGSEPVLVHSELGFGVKLVDRERHISCPTLCRSAIKMCMRRERISEEMRVLYVALTRARERLYLSALAENTDGLEAKYRDILSRPVSVENGRLHPYLSEEKETYLPWLLYSAVLENQDCGGKRLKYRFLDPADDPGAEEKDTDEAVRTDVASDALPECPPELLAELDKRFSFTYPFSTSVGIPSKITATAVKDAFAPLDPDEPDESIPLDFAKTKGSYSFRIPSPGEGEPPVTAAETGTATHAVLQYIDLQKTGSLEEIESEISRLREKGCITARQAGAVSRKMLLDFFASETGRRIVNASGKIRREFRFSVLTPSEELGFEPCGDKILLQGVADCCIEDPDGLVIIDYKTDRVTDEQELEEKTRLYSTQLRVYAGALGRIFGLPVKECVLFFLRAGVERKVSL